MIFQAPQTVATPFVTTNDPNASKTNTRTKGHAQDPQTPIQVVTQMQTTPLTHHFGRRGQKMGPKCHRVKFNAVAKIAIFRHLRPRKSPKPAPKTIYLLQTSCGAHITCPTCVETRLSATCHFARTRKFLTPQNGRILQTRPEGEKP